MSEFPFVRYQADKSIDLTTIPTISDLIPTKLAAIVWDCLRKCKTLDSFPQTETCELLILDRSIDQVPIKTGGFERKEVLLEEHDPVWLELRHSHIAEDITDECKVRLLMIYVATHPKKFESDKLTKLMELANLSPDDMDAVNNMRFLQAAPETKTSPSAISLKFHHKELIEKLSKNELPPNEFPCLNDPSTTFHGSTRVHNTLGRSVRSRPSTWARPHSSDDGYSSDSVMRHASGEFKKMGKRIFIFIVGGATRSELRVCHQLTTKLKREIILGSSSLDDPAQFVEKLKSLTPGNNNISLDDLEI
ncbi:hypothetical protein L1987_67918 [Smallanthus sonchifolius]|uniref:Uncharacterized protein n=1 Tax=Smallanthus sonchifolius TaxID=185202 RepID=A0ACB9B2T3_9ASTR|nr:hypothetical protein L1987_67918 [Smallanthus sonchifolius]